MTTHRVDVKIIDELSVTLSSVRILIFGGVQERLGKIFERQGAAIDSTGPPGKSRGVRRTPQHSIVEAGRIRRRQGRGTHPRSRAGLASCHNPRADHKGHTGHSAWRYLD